MALVGMVALLTAGVPAGRADLQARISRRFPVAHGAGRVSHRRRLPGRHRDARRHARRRRRRRTARCSQAWEVAPRPAASRITDAGAVRAGRRRHPDRPPRRAAPAGRRCSPSSARSPRAQRSTSPRVASRSSARCPADCRRSRCPTVTWSEVLALLPVAGSCFVMIIAQSAATARAFALRHRERVDENADILGLSAANAAAALSGTFVVNGSPTQTAMAERAGARSQLAQLVVRRRRAARAAVPDRPAAISAALRAGRPSCSRSRSGWSTCRGLRDIRAREPRRVPARRSSPPPSVALVGVEQGILLAIALSLFRHVRHSYRPHTAMLASRRGRALRIRGAGDAGHRDRARSHRLSLRRRSVLRQRQLASPTKSARSSSMRRRRCAGSSSTPARSPISTIRPRARCATCSTICAQRRSALVFGRVEPLPARRHGPARHHRRARRASCSRRCTKRIAAARGGAPVADAER